MMIYKNGHLIKHDDCSHLTEKKEKNLSNSSLT